jgi:uncharacterized protein (TIGR00251 family)
VSPLTQPADRQHINILVVRVTPRSKRNEIVGIMGDGTIKVHLTAPPVEGKANQALIEFLSEILDVPRSHLEILSGTSSRNKRIAVHGLDAKGFQERLTNSRRPV